MLIDDCARDVRYAMRDTGHLAMTTEPERATISNTQFYEALNTPLAAIGLPPSVARWATAHKLRTVRDLVLRSSRRLVSQRGLSFIVVRKTAEILEKHLGLPWERARERLIAPLPPSEPVASETVAAGDDETSIGADGLATPLSTITLPTRMANWIARRGLRTLRDLALVDVHALAHEPNIARKSIADTRAIIEPLLGCSWEEAHARLHAGAPGSGAENPVGEDLLALVDAVPLARVTLPTRMRAFVERAGIRTVGELWRFDGAAMAAEKNLGRKSIADTRVALRAFIECFDPNPAPPPPVPPLLVAWREAVSDLPANERLIVTRRAGVDGESVTLQELGDTLGVTRERIRQIERRAIQRFVSRDAMVNAIREHLDRVTAGRFTSIEQLAADPWFEGVLDERETFRFIVDRFFEGSWYVVRFEGTEYVGTAPPSAVEAAWDGVCDFLEQAEMPLAYVSLRHAIAVRTEAFPGLDDIIAAALQPELQIEVMEGVPTITGWGTAKHETILALLRSSPEPIAVRDLVARFGRGHMPREVLYLGRGIVGLRHHFPEIDAWRDRLVPKCVERVKAGAEDRQWTAAELFEDLQESGVALPEWFTYWHLGMLLRDASELRYLGRLRVRLRDGDDDGERLLARDVLLEVLEAAGGPLDEAVLAERASARTGLPPAIGMFLIREPFVKVGPARWGLVTRDVPGGADAIAAARERIANALRHANVGMTGHQAWRTIVALTRDHRAWTEELTLSVLRHDPRFLLSHGARVGLAEWDDVRVPTQQARLREWVDEANGALDVETACQRIGELYGEVPNRARLWNAAIVAGLRLDGAVIRRASPESP